MWNCYVEHQPFDDNVCYKWRNDRLDDIITICFIPIFEENVTQVRLNYISFNNRISTCDIFRISNIDVFYKSYGGIKLNRTIRSYFIDRVKDFLINSIPR